MTGINLDLEHLATHDRQAAAFAVQVAQHYHPDITATLLREPYQVPLSRDTSLSIPYHVAEPLHQSVADTIFYVNGWSEGPLNKLPFAAELAQQGAQVVLPDVVRQGYLHDHMNPKDPIDTQASDMIDIVRHEADGERVTLVAHSMGALVADRMVALDPERFADTTVIMLAPAGTAPEERFRSLGKRWLAFMREDSRDTLQQFPDPTDVKVKASQARIKSDLPRAYRELLRLKSHYINYHRLAERVARVAIMPYAADPLYPQRLLEPTIGRLLTVNPPENLSAITPVSFTLRDRETHQPLIGKGASHADEEVNPTRVASTIIDYLRP